MSGSLKSNERAQYELELNQLRYALSREKQASADLQNQMRRLKSGYEYRVGRIVFRLIRATAWPIRKYKRHRHARILEQQELRLVETHSELTEAAKNLPISNGSRFYAKFPISVAIITDEYMFNYYKDSFDRIFWLTPDNWQQVFTDNKIDLFIYVSCWRGGPSNEWRGHMRVPSLMKTIEEILRRCERCQIPAVFQSIEDPSNFAHFLPLAQRFPYIYSSDADIIDRYRAACPESRVRYGEYGINPVFNNPIASFRTPRYDAFFAGSYPRRYVDRCRDMATIFDSVIASGLSFYIADRNSDLKLNDYRFPLAYQDRVIRSFPHELLQSVHKLFSVNINLNSIKGSSTMCAMRVYELQAQGTELVSNYAKSVANKFPNVDIVSFNKDLSFYSNDWNRIEKLERRVRTAREVLSYKTAPQQIGNMLKEIGIQSPATAKPKLLVVSQKGAKQEGLVAVSDEVDLCFAFEDQLEDICLSEFQYIAFFNHRFKYASYYIRDMLNAYKYVDVPFVTREAYYENHVFISGSEHEYTDVTPDKYRTLYRLGGDPESVIRKINNLIEMGRGYSVDRFGFDYESCFSSTDGNPAPILSVIVPVHNNGVYLRDRCFESLLRQRRFAEFEILLVDDASTDEETRTILRTLEHRYTNVRVYSFTGDPSGSASRPRNQGIELSTCEYVTFLDPDNAISPGGYDCLLDRLTESDGLDAVIGFQLKITSDKTFVIGRLYDESSVIVDDPKNKVLLAKCFPVITTQSAIIRRNVLIEKQVKFIEGAVGQDTTFGYEVLLASSKVMFVRDAYLEYYAERAGSVTNIVGKKYFERSLLLEREQRRILNEYGCWEIYRECRAETFINGWYLPKLDSVSDMEYGDCLELLMSIANVNGISVELDERKIVDEA